VQAISLGPCGHAAIFKPIAATNNSLEIGDLLSCFPRLLFLGVQSRESISNQDSGVGPESIVVKYEVLKGNVRGQESDEGSLSVQTEGVVVKVDRMQLR
jgi:hypothetical protein